MLRVTLIHLLLLCAPTILYIVYLILIRKIRPVNTKDRVSNKLPFYPLIAIGAVLVVASLVSLSFSSGDPPEGHYTPPHIENGKIIPGQFE
ncbi:MAG: hypothetical protein CMM30_08935 [Rhodospirillaceae bacterium]|nr:hypothetical protein [Alphaproteobacteria bacterium]MBR73046.1 hypothetical protein [Rhodospirillaceae bacterium]